MSLVDLRESLHDFVRGKVIWWHVLLWLFGLYILIELFRFQMGSGAMSWVILVPYSFDFMMHEWMHVLTGFMPPIFSAMSGSGSELLLGLGLVIGAIWFKNWFALMFCLLWFDLTLQSAGTYMADAVEQNLPLVSLGGALSGQDATHDWHFIFGELNMLGASEFIGNSLRFFGHVVGVAGLAFAAYLIFAMIAARHAEKAQKTDSQHPWEKPPASKPVYTEPTKGALVYRKPATPPEKPLEKHDNF